MEVRVRSNDGKSWEEMRYPEEFIKKRTSQGSWQDFDYRIRPIFHTKLRGKWDRTK